MHCIELGSEFIFQLRSAHSDITSLKEKNCLLSQAKSDLEVKVTELNSAVDSANVDLLSSTRGFESFSVQVSYSLMYGLLITVPMICQI